MDAFQTKIEQSRMDRRKNLADWRAGRTHEMELPSGLKVMVADVTITDILFSGKLPPAIAPVIEKMAQDGRDDIDLKEIFENSPEFAEMINILVRLALVYPQIAERPDEDHITMNELNGDDRMAIFNWVNRETAAVQPFRDEGQPAEAGRAGAQVLDETQPDPAVAERLDRVAGG